MKKILALSSVAALGLGMQSAAHAYSTTAFLEFDWGNHPIEGNAEVLWTSSGVTPLASIANSTYFTSLTTYGGVNYYNQDFTAAGDCAPGDDVRKYGCNGTGGFTASSITDLGPGAKASGTLTITDTTMTGTLTVQSTTDEPTGATTTIIGGVRISNSIGDGATGYNLRAGDGSPFGNAWWGVSNTATLTVNLTGTFTNTSWNVNGGSVELIDSSFACQTGGVATGVAGSLCTNYTTGGVFEGDGSHLAWGMDADGSGTGTVGPIQIRDAGGVSVLSTLSGVLASMTVVSGPGDTVVSVATTAGETRRGGGSSSGGCFKHVRYDGTSITCGSLTVTELDIHTPVPVPAAVWLMGSALGLLGWIRRKTFA